MDANDNGIQDNGELPYTASPITVTLLNAATGAVISTLVTSNGLYTFTGVPSGTFVVSITGTAGFASGTAAGQHGGRVVGNDNGQTTGRFLPRCRLRRRPESGRGNEQ